MNRGIRTSANVTIRKGPPEKELLRLNSVSSNVKTSSSQEVKRKQALSRSITSEVIAKPASSNTKLTESQKPLTSVDILSQKQLSIVDLLSPKKLQKREKLV